jgi:hypothetical protein
MNPKSFFLTILCTSLFFSSCNRSGQNIYKVVPSNTAAVVSFSPGKLMEKADAADFNYMKDIIGDKEFNKFLFENPGISGIDVKGYSCAFMFGTDQKYLGVVMPIKNKKVFEKFLDKLGEEYGTEFTKEEAENYTFSKKDNNVLAWNKTLLIHLTRIKGEENAPVEEKLKELFSLEAENCILSEKDFKSFLSEQKDLNLWLTSNQISSFSDANLGMLNMLGSLNNNYAHVFLEFQEGAIVLSSNLLLNPDFKKSFDKFNIIDLNAEKDILKMLPANDLILAGNFRLNPEKAVEILKFLNSGDSKFMEDFEKETGKTPENILKSIQGSFAFSVNGVITTEANGTDADTLNCRRHKFPAIVAAMQLNDEKLFTDFLNIVKQKETIAEKDGYFIINSKEVPFYMGIKNNVILMSNIEKNISDVIANEKVENNLFSQDISKVLVDNPICFFLNLDRDSYSEKVKGFLDEEMQNKIGKEMNNYGASLKSLTLTGSLEKSEIRIELKDKSVNSLHALLKSMDKK